MARHSIVGMGLGAVAACSLTAPLFVLPSQPGAHSKPTLRGADGVQTHAAQGAPSPEVAASATASPVLGATLVFAALAAARFARRPRSLGVARRFFKQAEPEAPPPQLFDPSAQVGAVAPLGYFDPLGFCQVGDEEGFRKLRSSEIKHGRLAMMASVGAVAQHFLNTKVHGTFGAMGSEVGVFGMVVIMVVSSFVEASSKEDPAGEPGDFGDPLGLNMYTGEMRNKELNNGRMAMISVLGIGMAELATGKDAIEQFGF